MVHAGYLGASAAFLAVNTFFVLSGFLITCLLLAEWNQTKAIRLGNFYRRRALRLLPALVTLLIAYMIYAVFADPSYRIVQDFHEALRALFYCTNWARVFKIGRSDFLAHTWTLSIEEQFYLIWPLSLLFLLRRTSRTSLLWWVLLAALMSWLLRITLFVNGIEPGGDNAYYAYPFRLVCGSDARADSLLLGCFAGILLSSNLLPHRQWIETLLRAASTVSIIGLIFLSVGVAEPWMCCLGWFLASVFAVIIIVHLVTVSKSLLHRVLEASPLVWTGKVSYGLYLWHFPILRAIQTHPFTGWKFVFWPTTALVVFASYYLIEAPCLRLKRRFQSIE